MKLIVKADDYGYTSVYNEGTIEAVKNGIVTIVDLMLDTPGVEDGIERIKEYPWISVGWHGSHFWGKPVADASLVPSMIDPETGRFKNWRHQQQDKYQVKYDEALIECRAEIEKCIRLYGRAPEVARIRDDSQLEMAKKQICDEYGINYTYEKNLKRLENGTKAYELAESKDFEKIQQYNPVGYIKSCESMIKNTDTAISVWHCGYCDSYIAEESTFTSVRCIDVAAMCSPVLKQWIIDNKIELVNMHDYLYGTHDYQNHLKVIGSDLCVRDYQ